MAGTVLESELLAQQAEALSVEEFPAAAAAGGGGAAGLRERSVSVELNGRRFDVKVQEPIADFVALGRAYGAHAELVTRTDEFAAALERCLAHDGPSLIEIRTDPEAITPRTTLTALRNAKR